VSDPAGLNTTWNWRAWGAPTWYQDAEWQRMHDRMRAILAEASLNRGVMSPENEVEYRSLCAAELLIQEPYVARALIERGL
jgi:hypothetical protein